MRHGKDFMADKPGMTSLAQLSEVRQAQEETGRIYSVCFSEHFDSRATVEAGRLVQAGAIGRVVQTLGTGPHRPNPASRPPWFFDKERYGGILADIGSPPGGAVPVLHGLDRGGGRVGDRREL